MNMLLTKSFRFRTPRVADLLVPTQWVVSATISLLQSHLVLFWMILFTLSSTLSSCSAPAPSSPKPGLRSQDPLQKMYVSIFTCSAACFDLVSREINMLVFTLRVSGGETAEGTADGNEGTQRDLYGA